MKIAKDEHGYSICARCGKRDTLTKDHFIPKSCRMTVNEEGNYVGLCVLCNREKADKFVLPSWYIFLSTEQQNALNRYVRYCRSWINSRCVDPEILVYVNEL